MFLHGKAITGKNLLGCTKNLNQDKRWTGLRNLGNGPSHKNFTHANEYEKMAMLLLLLSGCKQRNILQETDFLPTQTEPFASQKGKKRLDIPSCMHTPIISGNDKSIWFYYIRIRKYSYFSPSTWKMMGGDWAWAVQHQDRDTYTKTHSAGHQELISGVGHDVLATSARGEKSAWGGGPCLCFIPSHCSRKTG